jgi:uncharacterized membrane protein YcjF (UPF0283 family)
MSKNELVLKEDKENKKEIGKLTLEEYRKKYSKPVNEKVAITFLFIFAVAIGIIIFFCLFSFVIKVYETFDKNNIAIYILIPIALLIFICVYVIPLHKIHEAKPFITNVDSRNAREAKKYNKALRESIADKMIDLKAKTTGVTGYSEVNVGKLAIARQTHDDEELKKVLTETYDTDVKAAANKMIRDHAFKVGVKSALSQFEKIDTLFVVTYDLNLINDLIYLYGFRPSDTQLMKCYQSFIADALIAYGLGNATSAIATGVVKKMGNVVDKVPVLGSMVSTVIDSVTQGFVNASLTVIIGLQTKKYLMKEYHLQDILDTVELPTEEEEAEEASELMDSLKKDITLTANKGKVQTA